MTLCVVSGGYSSEDQPASWPVVAGWLIAAGRIWMPGEKCEKDTVRKSRYCSWLLIIVEATRLLPSKDKSSGRQTDKLTRVSRQSIYKSNKLLLVIHCQDLKFRYCTNTVPVVHGCILVGSKKDPTKKIQYRTLCASTVVYCVLQTSITSWYRTLYHCSNNVTKCDTAATCRAAPLRTFVCGTRLLLLLLLVQRGTTNLFHFILSKRFRKPRPTSNLQHVPVDVVRPNNTVVIALVDSIRQTLVSFSICLPLQVGGPAPSSSSRSS